MFAYSGGLASSPWIRSVVGIHPRALALGLLLSGAPALAHVYQYENAASTTSAAIPNANSDAQCNAGTGALSIPFTVGDSFTTSAIAVGLTIDHNRRGDIRAVLIAPDTSVYELFDNSDDGDADYDVLVSSNSDAGEQGTAPRDDNDGDPVAAPFFNRLVTASGNLNAAEAANGTWTLRLCDRNTGGGGVTGTHLRSRLVLVDATAAAGVCTGTRLNYEWGNNGDGNQFTSATLGGVTISQNGAGRVNYAAGFGVNQVTATGTANGETGYYSLFMDAATVGGTQDSEIMGQLAAFQFSVPVHGLQYSLIDTDQFNDDFEDVMRVEGTRAGVYQRYQRTTGGAHQTAGDMIEGDSDTTGAAGTSTYVFDRAVDTTSVFYFAGDDVTPDPGDQFVGITNLQFCAFDYGDAPASYGTALNGGARHVLGERQIYLGSIPPDGESDGQPNASATADDATQVGGLDDEDGIGGTFPTCPNNGTYTLTVAASDLRAAGADATLVGYIDWNRNNVFDDNTSEESAALSVPRGGADPANYALTWSGVPANCGGTTQTYLRLRLTTDAARAGSPIDGVGLSAPDGEVEDYRITASTLPVTLARVESVREGGMIRVAWATATENANAGFRIWGKRASGEMVLLGRVKSASADSLEPRRYETTVSGRGIVALEIEDVSLFGDNRQHGPFKVGSSVGEDPEIARIDWPAIKAEAGVASDLERVAAAERGEALRFDAATDEARPTPIATAGLLLVHEAGIHRVTYEELAAAGIDLGGADPSRIAVLDGGRGIPRVVSSPGGPFGPGAYVEFLARPALTLASPVDAYVIQVDARKVVSAGPLVPHGGLPEVVGAEDSYHAERVYGMGSPNGDPWYDQGLLAWGGPAALAREFELPDLAAGPVTLRVALWGYGDFPGEAPDHHVVFAVNGVEVGEATFDGVSPVDVDIDASDLVGESGNVFELRVPGDVPYPWDYVAFEGFDVAYSRRALARDGRFRADYSGHGSFAVGGFAEGEPVSIWAAGPVSARGEQAAAGGVVGGKAGGEVFAASAERLLRPGLVAGVPVAKKASQANYLIVTHPAFATSLGALVALQQSRGFSTEVVTVDSIYAAYSDHVASPDAIQRFVTASLARGRLRYVLIVGSDTVDPYDHLGTGSVSYVPSAYLPMAPTAQFSPTDEVFVDRNRDGLGDVPIGRLPVRTPAELDAVVAKILDWEANVGQRGRAALLAAGASDGERRLASLNEQFAASLGGWASELAPVDDQGSPAVRGAILQAFDGGRPLIGFVGHSSPGQWDFNPLLRWQDVPAMQNAGAPVLVAAWGCWNSYYVDPGYESLAAHLLRAVDGGAAAAIGATTLTTEASHEALGELFYQRVGAGARTVGEAFRGAKQDLFRTSNPKDAILGMTLLGDPAMSLPPVK